MISAARLGLWLRLWKETPYLHNIDVYLSVPSQVKIAATRALGELASKSKFNRTKIAEEVECMPSIVEQLRLADMQLKLTKVIEQRCLARSHLGLVARLRDAIGDPSLRLVQNVLQQVRKKAPKLCAAC